MWHLSNAYFLLFKGINSKLHPLLQSSTGSYFHLLLFNALQSLLICPCEKSDSKRALHGKSPCKALPDVRIEG